MKNKTHLNMPGFKLPHMSPLSVKKVAKEKLPEFDRTPKRLNIQEPIPVRMEGPINSNHDERALSQEQKDSLHEQANKFGKAFFSPEFGVNVDPEDGVLSNRPTFKPNLDDFSKLPKEQRGGYTPEELEALYPKSEGRKLTYDVEDKPIEDLVKDAYAKRRDEYMSMVGKKKHPMLPAQTEDEALREFFAESYSTKFNPETREIERLVSSSGDGAMSEEELAKVPSYLRNPFKQ